MTLGDARDGTGSWAAGQEGSRVAKVGASNRSNVDPVGKQSAVG